MSKLYEQDFMLWLREQANLLQDMHNGKQVQLDLQHLIAEVIGIGQVDKKEFCRHVEKLVFKLFKWLGMQEHRSLYKLQKINGVRTYIKVFLKQSPSLANTAKVMITMYYARALRRFEDNAYMSWTLIPRNCLWSLNDLLNMELTIEG